jgi:hypothetical protein
MKSRHWIIAAAGAVAFSTVIANAAAAPMGAATTMLKTISDDVSALTEVAQRRNSRTSSRHKSGSNDPRTDSGEPPFGSALWWAQHCCAGRGR